MQLSITKIALSVVAAFITLIVVLSSITQIDTGNVGVLVTRGQISDEVLPPGVYVRPFKTMIEVSAKEVPLVMEDLKPQTIDKISLTDLDIDIYVQASPDKVSQIVARWPGDFTKIIRPDGQTDEGVGVGLSYVQRQAREAIYTTVATFKSDTVHTKRSEIAAEVVKELQAGLDKEAGAGWFFVRSANVRNLVTDPALEAQIKAAANAQFERIAKDQQIEVAKREAERIRIVAQGEADAVRIKAQAISVQGGNEYVQLEAIKKWNGVLPTTQAGGAVPFINVK